MVRLLKSVRLRGCYPGSVGLWGRGGGLNAQVSLLITIGIKPQKVRGLIKHLRPFLDDSLQ